MSPGRGTTINPAPRARRVELGDEVGGVVHCARCGAAVDIATERVELALVAGVLVARHGDCGAAIPAPRRKVTLGEWRDGALDSALAEGAAIDLGEPHTYRPPMRSRVLGHPGASDPGGRARAPRGRPNGARLGFALAVALALLAAASAAMFALVAALIRWATA